MTWLIKTLLLFFGTLFLIVGFIGLLIPVMPTMPFLLLAGLCYINSSKRLYNWLVGLKFFGPHVKNYVEYRRIKREYKIIGLVMIWIPTLITVIFIIKQQRFQALSLVIAILVSAHILALESMTQP